MKPLSECSKPVCIAGMHRSGTSMVARLLNLCGLYLGPQDKMLGPLPHNPAGFWEHLGFLELNEKILACLGGGWDYFPSQIPDGWELESTFTHLMNKAKENVQEFIGCNPWGWKDPRNSVTLPFWKRLFPNLKVIICLRNPLEVALSLSKRNGHSHAFGLHLWLTYNQRLLTAAPFGQRLITHYDAYFSDPQKELRRVLEWLGWSVSEEKIDRACETISISLRHNRIPMAKLLHTGVPSDVLSLYIHMCKEAGIQPEAQLEYEKAQQLINGGKYEDAIAALQILLNLYSDHALAHNDLGALYFQKGQKEKALLHFKTSVELDSNNLTARKNLADLYLDVGRIQEAIQIYEKILVDNPKDVDVLFSLSGLFTMFGLLDDAKLMCERILELEPGNVAAIENLKALANLRQDSSVA